MKITPIAAFMLSSVALSACLTQSPAQVVMKGNNYYGASQAPQARVASAVPAARVVQAAPRAAVKSEPSVSSVVARAGEGSYEPRPSYGYAPAKAAPVGRVEMAQVTVKELEPLTASTAAPKPVEPVLAAPAANPAPARSAQVETAMMELPAPTPAPAPAPVAEKAPELLPEPQARVVAETKTLPEKPGMSDAAPASKGFIWPVKGKIISGFGSKSGGEYNDGINIAAREGEPIVAAADGEVVYSGNELKGYGNMVILRHEGGIMSAYAHADRILVSKGERVRQGVTIATVGKSGGVEQAQVHFGVRKNKAPIDPMTVLGSGNLASR